MEYGFGGLFTLFFLWGLWEWSKSMKRENSQKHDVDKDETIKVEKKPDNIARGLIVIIGIGIVILAVIYIINL